MNDPITPDLPPAPSPPPHPAPPVRKSNPWPWIIGGCGCLFILVLIILGVAGFWVYSRAAKPVNFIPSGSRPSPVKDTTPSRNARPSKFVVPPNWTTYVNTRDKLPASLQDKVVGFSFSYPPDKFKVVPDTTNFIKIEENLHDEKHGDFTLENFSVGYMYGPVGLTSQQDQDGTYPALFEQLGAKFAKTFPNYKELAQITDHVAGVRGRTMLFQAEFKDTAKGDIKFYGKLILAREPGKERGVAIILLATTLDPAIKGPDDVGTKGDMASILSSFRFTE